MTFSEFAQLLHPFYSDGKSGADFVITLVDNIMRDPSTDADDQRDADGEYNPLMSLGIDARKKIFNGADGRTISKRNASSILGRIDKVKFEEFIDTISDDSLNKLCDAVKVYGIYTNYKDIAAKCADTFEQVLLKCSGVTTLMVVKENSLLEMSRELLPDLSVMGKYNLQLLIEAKGFCPNDCGKPLYITNNGSSIERCRITKIKPDSSSTAVANMIALCPECYDKYALSHTEEDILRLSNIKTALVREVSASEQAAGINIEAGIKEVLNKIATVPDGGLVKLTYKPTKVKKKIRKENGLLLRRILHNVNTYYQYVKDLFQQLSKTGKLRFELLAVQVRSCYLQECGDGRSQTEVYEALVTWLQSKTNEDRDACDVVISYFVQNCEVFDEIAE